MKTLHPMTDHAMRALPIQRAIASATLLHRAVNETHRKDPVKAGIPMNWRTELFN